MEWFKFYGAEFLSDPKVFALSPSERGVFITLLSLASMAGNDQGQVEYLTAERLAAASGADPSDEEWDRSVATLEKLQRLKIIKVESNGTVTVLNWCKRQERYISNAERQRRYRERQKSNAGVTTERNKSNARIEKNRIDNTAAKAAKSMKNYNERSHDNDDEPQLDSESLEVLNKKPKKEKSHALEVYALFGEGYPRNWLINKTQRLAADNLFRRGMPQVQAALKFYRAHKSDEFCPQILSPYDLDAKWEKLFAFKKKQS